ncbi:MAG TPA: hypothetical protein VMT12_16550 [Syntrophales bacterium]|nr:hypothetical protein [Syntrophales bacterium]
MTASSKVLTLRYASSFVITTYIPVRLIPHDSRALPMELSTSPSIIQFIFRSIRG